nr:hypothetical protein [Pseudarcicella sp.]
MKKTSIKWLDLFQLRYNASESFLKELNNQLREQYEHIMGHPFDIKLLMIEPIAETRLKNLPIDGVKYILACEPQKTWYSYG